MMKRIRIRFLLPEGSDSEAEWMWAIERSPGTFELDNSPFHVYGVSHGDLFQVREVGDTLTFERILKKGGHRTIRLRFGTRGSHEDFERIWPPLGVLGCSFEGSQIDRPLYSIDLPPGVDLTRAVDYLAGLEAGGLLEYEEADC
jgi:hypothetical protein